jgi:hypothetical protein
VQATELDQLVPVLDVEDVPELLRHFSPIPFEVVEVGKTETN